MKKLLYVFFAFLLLLALVSCTPNDSTVNPPDSNSEAPEEENNAADTKEGSEIYINGDVLMSLEANSLFVDPGVTYPDGFTLVTTGKVVSTALGKQQLVYKVYAKDGTLAKEMHRYVNVVDTSAPTYRAISNKTYYAGVNYTIEDFISEYTDNYNSQKDITVTSSSLVFTTTGLHNIKISFKDSSGNVSEYSETIDVSLDMAKLINEAYKNQSHKVSTSTTGIGSVCTHVQINSNASLGYFDSGSIHYSERISSNLGTYASIQISAKYGEFGDANVSFHISNSGEEEYTTGFATIDATQNSVSVTRFRSTINDLGLDTDDMLAELNLSLNSVLNNFKTYMRETYQLELK